MIHPNIIVRFTKRRLLV